MRIGIITGSGTYALPHIEAGGAREVGTPFGSARGPGGRLAGADVTPVARHGDGHLRLSSQVEHRANIAALRAGGVYAFLLVTVCGALDPELVLGTLVVFDGLYFLCICLPDGSL